MTAGFVVCKPGKQTRVTSSSRSRPSLEETQVLSAFGPTCSQLDAILESDTRAKLFIPWSSPLLCLTASWQVLVTKLTKEIAKQKKGLALCSDRIKYTGLMKRGQGCPASFEVNR